MEKVLAGGEDLAYDIELEVMPDFEPADISGVSLKRPVYRSDRRRSGRRAGELVAQNRTYAARDDESAVAADGDQLLIDFVGTIDGDAFEGGSAEDEEMVIGRAASSPASRNS